MVSGTDGCLIFDNGDRVNVTDFNIDYGLHSSGLPYSKIFNDVLSPPKTHTFVCTMSVDSNPFTEEIKRLESMLRFQKYVDSFWKYGYIILLGVRVAKNDRKQ
jgi:hypothetical protein